MKQRRLRDTASATAATKVDSLQRGLEILRSFRAGETSLRMSDIVERTGISRVSAQKLLNTLTAHHFLRYLPKLDQYEPDVSCFVLGHALRASLPILPVARPIMRELAKKLGIDVALAAREGLQMLVMEYSSARPGVEEASAGTLVPLAQSALGRAWLWAQKPALQGEYIERVMTETGADTPNGIPGLYRAFQDLGERGYCISLGEWTPDRRSIAMPLVLAGGREVLALGAIEAERRHDESFFRETVAAALLEAGARIKRELPRSETP